MRRARRSAPFDRFVPRGLVGAVSAGALAVALVACTRSSPAPKADAPPPPVDSASQSDPGSSPDGRAVPSSATESAAPSLTASGASPPGGSASAASSHEAATPTRGAHAGPPVDPAVLAKLCAAAPCTGPFDTVLVYRAPNGQVGAFEHRGDIRRCSHPPSTFYDAHGATVDAIPMKPVVPGSVEAKGFDAIRERATHGFAEAESTSCDAKK